MQHLVNIYIPPKLATPEYEAWDKILQVLDQIPPNEPCILVGDLNCHIAALDGFMRTACPLHGCQRSALAGKACSRGRMVLSTLLDRDLHILNGCPRLQPHTCTTVQRGGATVRTTVDMMVTNSAALQHIAGVAIEDRPIRRTSKNYHSHLLVKLAFSPVTQAHADSSSAPRFKWVPDSIDAWKAHSSSASFVASLQGIVRDPILDSDSLNAAVEQHLLQEALQCGATTTINSKAPRNPTKYCRLNQPWFTTSCFRARTSWHAAR